MSVIYVYSDELQHQFCSRIATAHFVTYCQPSNFLGA